MLIESLVLKIPKVKMNMKLGMISKRRKLLNKLKSTMLNLNNWMLLPEIGSKAIVPVHTCVLCLRMFHLNSLKILTLDILSLLGRCLQMRIDLDFLKFELSGIDGTKSTQI